MRDKSCVFGQESARRGSSNLFSHNIIIIYCNIHMPVEHNSTRENLGLPEVDRTDMRLEVPRHNQRVNHWPMVVKCQVYLRTTLCSNMMVVMAKPWLAQKSIKSPSGSINTLKSWFNNSILRSHLSIFFGTAKWQHMMVYWTDNGCVFLSLSSLSVKKCTKFRKDK